MPTCYWSKCTWLYGVNDIDSCFSTQFASNFWIGLYNEEQFNDESSCACPEDCPECRNKFEWLDERAGEGYVTWAGNNEPGEGEKCVRINRNNLLGTSCTAQLGYMCYEGQCSYTKYSFNANQTKTACILDINECSLNVRICENNGTCINTFRNSYCECVEGFTGDSCEMSKQN